MADDWNTTVICPIFKNGDPEDVANYRPLSLASVACKGYEQIINRSFSRFLANVKQHHAVSITAYSVGRDFLLF